MEVHEGSKPGSQSKTVDSRCGIGKGKLSANHKTAIEYFRGVFG